MNQALQYYSSVLYILCLTYFLTSITIPGLRTSDMRHLYGKRGQRFLLHQLAL